MKKSVLLFVLVLLVALLSAIPALATPPDSSGPNVVRYQGIFAFLVVDEARGTLAIVGTNIVEFCSGNVDFDLVNIQDIHVPEDANRIIQIIHGDDVTASVWPFTEFDCALFNSTEPLATGAIDLVSTDNDLVVFLNPDNVNWNAFGFTGHSWLTEADGDRTRLNLVYRCVWDGVDENSGHCTQRINLR